MSSRWKKVWADFWGNKSRSAITILTIAVGVFAVGFNSNLGAFMINDMDEDYLSANPSEAQVYTSPLDDDQVELARQVPGVDAVEGRSQTQVRLVHPDGRMIDIVFTGLDDPEALQVNLLKPATLEETALPPLNEKEMLIDSAASGLGFEPGDTITIELDDGKRRELHVAGYIHDVTGIPYNLANVMNAYVTPDTLEWLGGSAAFNMLEVSVAERQTNAEHVTQVAQAVADRLERAGEEVYFVSVYQPGHHFAYNITQGVFFILAVLGWMTVLLSGFLIINTITALMTQQTRQIGIMKATGGGTLQIAGMYIALILFFGLVALAISIPLANMAAYDIGGGMASYLNFRQGPFKWYPATVIQQVIVALVVPLLAATWPVYHSVRITVHEAINDYGIGGSNGKQDKTAVGKSALLLPRPMRLSLRNAFRRKLRLGLTLFTLVLGGGIFIGVFNLWGSFDKTLEDIQGYVLADINVSFGRYYRFEEVASLAESIPGVSSVEGWTEYPGTLKMEDEEAGTQILFVAPPSTSTLIDPIITAGRWLTTGDENAVVIGNHLLQIFPDLKVGDWLTIEIDGRETEWHIIGVYSIAGNVSPPLLYTNYEYISRVIRQPGQVYSLRVLTEQHDAASQTAINDQLLELLEARGIQVNNSQLSSEWLESQTATTDILVYFMLVMAVMIAFVGGLGLMGTMSINVLERTREIGVMRAIGASNGDIQGIVIVEGLVIGLLSWAISILLSLPISNVLTFGVGMAILTAPMPTVYGLDGILAWLIGTLIIATIASAVPARRASKLTVRDTLAYE
jgi:putative ABC transport system permease protein